MALLVRACVIVTVVTVATFLPFVPGGHDPLAVPLSALAWALGRVGLLLVPVGALWLWASRAQRSRPAPPALLMRITLGTCVVIAIPPHLDRSVEGRDRYRPWDPAEPGPDVGEGGRAVACEARGEVARGVQAHPVRHRWHRPCGG